MLTKTDLLENVKKECCPLFQNPFDHVSSIPHWQPLLKKKRCLKFRPGEVIKKSRYATRPPDLKVYLDKTRKEFDQVCLKLKKAGIGAEQVFAAFEKMLSLSRDSCFSFRSGHSERISSPPRLNRKCLKRF